MCVCVCVCVGLGGSLVGDDEDDESTIRHAEHEPVSFPSFVCRIPVGHLFEYQPIRLFLSFFL